MWNVFVLFYYCNVKNNYLHTKLNVCQYTVAAAAAVAASSSAVSVVVVNE